MSQINLADQNQLQDKAFRISKRSAYHQAGRAAAIYLGNKLKKLPAVHFQITAREGAYTAHKASQANAVYQKRIVEIEGGCLLHSLPLSKTNPMPELSFAEQQEYRLAYEADMVNILTGPLAEAKYVAIKHNKVFNPNSVYVGALKFYGGKADMDAVNEYLDSIFNNTKQRDRKLTELFLDAYSFVNNSLNWQAISSLAKHMVEQPKEIYDCNEIIYLLDSSRLAA